MLYTQLSSVSLNRNVVGILCKLVQPESSENALQTNFNRACELIQIVITWGSVYTVHTKFSEWDKRVFYFLQSLSCDIHFAMFTWEYIRVHVPCCALICMLHVILNTLKPPVQREHLQK